MLVSLYQMVSLSNSHHTLVFRSVHQISRVFKLQFLVMIAEDESTQDVRTIFVGGLSEKATDSLLYELFFQAGSKVFSLFVYKIFNFF